MHSFVKFLFSSDNKTKLLKIQLQLNFGKPLLEQALIRMFLEIMCANATHRFNFNLWLVADLLGLSLFPKSCKVLQDYLSFFQVCLHVSCITFAFI